jgi:hypothetical protein
VTRKALPKRVQSSMKLEGEIKGGRIFQKGTSLTKGEHPRIPTKPETRTRLSVGKPPPSERNARELDKDSGSGAEFSEEDRPALSCTHLGVLHTCSLKQGVERPT